MSGHSQIFMKQDSPSSKRLETILHRELRKLPPVEAPSSLIADVMTAIQARRQAAWWRRPWLSWPAPIRALTLCLGLLFTSGAFYTLGIARTFVLERIEPHALANRIESLLSLGHVFETLGRAFLLTLQSMDQPVWIACLCVIALMYAACIALSSAALQVIAKRRFPRN
jgi:hypothetical protein